MINSLSNDSHIAQPNNHSYFYQRNGLAKSSVSSVVAKQGIIANKPAEVSFRGFPSSLLVHQKPFQELIKNTRTFLGNTTDNKKVQELINDSVKILTGDSNPSSETEKFIGLHRNTIDAVIEKSKVFIEEDNKKDPLSSKEMTDAIRRTVNTSVEVYPTVENPGWVYRSNLIKKWFISADNSQAVFSAVVGVALACLMRPAAIMTLPANKENKDNNKYAAAHSVASGAMGFLIAMVISKPIADSIEKFKNDPAKFLKDKKLEYLTHTRAFEAARKFANMGHEIILAPPRAMITIALIPPILKHVFGWEKKKPQPKVDVKPETIAKTEIDSSNKDEQVMQVSENSVGGAK